MLITIAFCTNIFLNPISAKNSDLEITPQSNPLFKSINIAPGKTFERKVQFHNIGDTQTYEIKVFAETTEDENELFQEIEFAILNEDKNNILPSEIKTIADFIKYTDKESDFVLNALAPNEKETYLFQVIIPFELSNKWQGESAIFDLEFRYSGSVLGENTENEVKMQPTILGTQLSQTGQNIVLELLIGSAIIIVSTASQKKH